jgi:membrane-bound metal-dependent hydrolase YbcI (DUF457 family)
MGYLISRVNPRYYHDGKKAQPRQRLLLLLAAVFFSLMPDIDILPGLLMGDIGRFHNQWTHSLIVGSGVALLAGLIALWRKDSFRFWFLLAWVSYSFHVIMDAFTWGGRGVMLLWPLTDQRFEGGPVSLFMGVRWSEGVWSPEHLLTLVTELAFVGLVYLAAWVYERFACARTPCPERRIEKARQQREADHG